MTLTVKLRVEKNRFKELSRPDWKKAHAQMGAYFLREMHRMFDTEGASRGHAWQGHSEAYAEAKKETGRSSKVLQLTGTLRASAQQLEVSGERLKFGFTDPKAADIQRGQNFPGGKLVTLRGQGNEASVRISGTPPRTLLEIIPRDRDMYEKRLGAIIRERRDEL